MTIIVSPGIGEYHSSTITLCTRRKHELFHNDTVAWKIFAIVLSKTIAVCTKYAKHEFVTKKKKKKKK